MKLTGIQAKQKKNFKATTNSKHNMPVFPNLLKRDFNVSQQNKVWVGDITYIWGTKVGSAQPDKSNKSITLTNTKELLLFKFVIDEYHIIVLIFGRIDGHYQPCFLDDKSLLKYCQL